jgi:hypothetical protein
MRLEFSEIISLNAVLRSNWLSIALLYPEKCPLSNKYPCMSMIFDPSGRRGCVFWGSTPTKNGNCVLTFACGDLVFLSFIAQNKILIGGAVLPSGSSLPSNPIVGLSVSDHEIVSNCVFQVSITFSDGETSLISVSLDSNPETEGDRISSVKVLRRRKIPVLTYEKQIDGGFATSVTPGGICLGMCSELRGPYRYFTKRTTRCLEILRGKRSDS